ncbi:MAG: PRC-barrel domain-containing protein [Actinobacteria bacterium]|nr:PRC-barrel domain-containing protein [Actinomycetota bacterium]
MVTAGSAALEERFAGYEVRDDAGEKIGEIDLIFADENGRPEYVGVKSTRTARTRGKRKHIRASRTNMLQARLPLHDHPR